MELKDFIKNFAGIFEETECDAISAETVFTELPEWDSVMVLSLISMLDEEYGIVVDVDDMSAAHTVGDLFNYVQSLSV